MTGGKDSAKNATGSAPAEKAARAPDREKLTDKQLAKAILARTVRPRAGELRRLAEAVLQKSPPKKKGKGKKAKSGKLAKIPRPKK